MLKETVDIIGLYSDSLPYDHPASQDNKEISSKLWIKDMGNICSFIPWHRSFYRNLPHEYLAMLPFPSQNTPRSSTIAPTRVCLNREPGLT